MRSCEERSSITRAPRPAEENGMPEGEPHQTLYRGLTVHVGGWLLLGLVAFERAGASWFPATPATRWLVALLLIGLAGLAWPRATRRVWLLSMHSLSLAALTLAALEMALGALHPPEREPSRYPYPYRMHGFAPNQHAAQNSHHASTNDAGLREPGPIALAKPPGTLPSSYSGDRRCSGSRWYAG